MFVDDLLEDLRHPVDRAVVLRRALYCLSVCPLHLLI